MGENFTALQSVYIRTEMLTDKLHVLATDFFAECIYLIGEFVSVIENFAGRGYFYAFKLVGTALGISLEF